MGDFVVEIINQIVVLKTTIIATLIGILAFLIAFLILTARFKWTGKNTKLMGFFYSISSKHSIMFATIWIKFFIVAAIIYDGCTIYPAQIALYLFSVIFYLVHRHRLVESLFTIVNNIVIVFILFVAEFLHNYTVEIAADSKIKIVLILIEIFLLAYSLFDIVWSAMNITTDITVEWDVYKRFDEHGAKRQQEQLARELKIGSRRDELAAKKHIDEEKKRKQAEWAKQAAGGSK